MMSADPFMTMKKMKKSSHNENNQRRFSDEQIKSLEMMFKSETRLEPRKKVQLARELGLQPRQVAIWFQNKRARWKYKQLETELNILRQNYNDLASQFESLKKENQGLVSELHKLNEATQTKQDVGRQRCGDQGVVTLGSADHESEKEYNMRRKPEEVRPEMEVSEKGNHDEDEDVYNNNIEREYFGGFEEEVDHLMNIVEPADSCLTSSDNWRGFKANTNLLDQSSSNYRWWEFWS